MYGLIIFPFLIPVAPELTAMYRGVRVHTRSSAPQSNVGLAALSGPKLVLETDRIGAKNRHAELQQTGAVKIQHFI